jgi:hypothetical protein
VEVPETKWAGPVGNRPSILDTQREDLDTQTTVPAIAEISLRQLNGLVIWRSSFSTGSAAASGYDRG